MFERFSISTYKTIKICYLIVQTVVKVVEWRDVKEYLVREVKNESLSDDTGSPSSIYQKDILFDKSSNYDENGTKYEIDELRSDDELVELLGEDFAVETDHYPSVEQFGYSMQDDGFTLKSESLNREYKVAGEDSGYHSILGTPFGDNLWEIYSGPEDQVKGTKRNSSIPCDLSESEVSDDIGLMVDTMEQVENKLYEDERNILFTSNYTQDVDRLERGQELAEDSKKIRDADANLNLESVSPRMAMSKRMSGSLSPLVQFKHERASLRGLFIDGFRFSELESDKIYGITLLDKDNGEQEKLSKRIADKSNEFFQNAESYAEYILEEDERI